MLNDDLGVDIGVEKSQVPRWRGSLKKDRKAKTVLMGKKKVRICSVLFVPQTPHGELARLLRDKMDKLAVNLGWKYKIVEKAGVSIKHKVSKSNPWALDMCEGCLPCKMAGKKLECRKRNLVYETACKSCENDPNKKNFVYVGETARSSWE